MRYRFTYEITSNCNYKCDYCIAYKDEQYSDLNTINNIIYFFNQLNNLNTTDSIEIQLFGGECTLHPNFIYIIEELSKLNKVKFILFTNLSSDLNIYKQFCEIASNKINNISVSYHYNHCSTKEFINKIGYILNNYNVIVKAHCMLAKDRYTEDDYINIFTQFINNKKFKISLFPILQSNVCDNVEPSYDNIIENKNKELQLHIDKDTVNTRYNSYCDSYITNAFISSDGILNRCFQYKSSFRLNLNERENIINKYIMLCKLKMKCDNKFCCYGAQWKNF